MVREGLSALRGAALAGTLALGALQGCAHLLPPAARPPAGTPAEPPPAPREFRGAWVATVANIDWPSLPGAEPEAQRAEAREIVARARALGLNTLILQVRPAADALYPSALEPWSEYLTGAQGRPPAPAYDPLAFWIEEAHQAGLGVHAWFNPYRARHPSARSPLAPGHPGLARPELVKAYGDQLWMDPGEPGAAAHALAVVLDVVRRYDLDGVHIDDYFYPYPVKDPGGQEVPFPDEPSWRAYQAGGGDLPRADWRRRNVDGFIQRLYGEVHREKPHVLVGVSPFGLGRPDRRPPGVAGFSQYDALYADVEHWLARGWLDYLAPQLYWPRASKGQPFAPLLAYWRDQNPRGRHIWPGLFTSRTGSSDLWPPEEVAAQVQQTRDGDGAPGHAHFSMVALLQDYGGVGALLAAAYDGPALVPATPWLGAEPPPAPRVRLRRRGAAVRVEPGAGAAPPLLAVWGRYGGAWRFFTLPGAGGALPARWGGAPLGPVVVSAVGRTGLESGRVAAEDAGY